MRDLPPCAFYCLVSCSCSRSQKSATLSCCSSSAVSFRMKRSDQSSSSDASAPELKKRKVAYSTYQKWKTRDCQTITWLNCDTEVSEKQKIVTRLRCAVCSRFKASIARRRNFSDKWLSGGRIKCVGLTRAVGSYTCK